MKRVTRLSMTSLGKGRSSAWVTDGAHAGGGIRGAVRRLRTYPAPLRDLLMRLATTDLFRPRWSAAIHDEWTRAVLATRPELEGPLERTRKLMDAHVMDALVTGYEPLIGTLQLPDPDDRHVLAAAITGGRT